MPRRLVLIAFLFGGIVPALGAGREDARSAGLSGTFLVCKEYGTVRGTFLTDGRGRDIARLNYPVKSSKLKLGGVSVALGLIVGTRQFVSD